GYGASSFDDVGTPGFGGGNAGTYVFGSGAHFYGGGGAGMGGGVFVRSGSLTLANSSFTNNVAAGGSRLSGSRAGQGLGGAIFAMKSTTNTNGNNQGMPSRLSAVTLNNVNFTDSGASDNSDAAPVATAIVLGTDLDNEALFGATITGSALSYTDTTPVFTSITRQTPSTQLTSADTLVFRVTFDQSIETIQASDFVVTGTTATVTQIQPVDNFLAYDITVSGGDLADLDGIVGLDLAAGHTITDFSGNAIANAEPPIDEVYTVDNALPTVVINAPANTNSSFTATFAFSEAVNDFTVGDIVVGNGSASDFTTVDGSTYTVLITPTADGDVTIDVAANAATDAAGNSNTAATQVTSSFDGTVPTVDIQNAPTDTNGAFTATFAFSEAVNDFTVGDIVVGNGSASDFTTVDGSTYTALITPTADGDVTIDVAANVATDTAGNSNTAATQVTSSFDGTDPTVEIQNVPTDTNSSFTATFEFSEAVSDFTVGDIVVGNGSASDFATVNGSTYTALITPTADGSVTIDVAANVATDAAGNNNTAATQVTSNFDATAPTLSLSTAANNLTNTTFAVTATFSEDITDFTAYDITISNGNISNFSGAGTTYTFEVTPISDGAVSVDVAEGVATDTAGNNNVAASSLLRTFDGTAPAVTAITRKSPAVSSTASDTVVFEVQFSETVTSIAAGAFTLETTGAVTGTIASVSTTSGNQVDVTVNNIAGNGTLGLSVASNTALKDTAGNTVGSFDAGQAYAIDQLLPTVTSLTSNLATLVDSSAGTDAFVLTTTFSEAMDTTVNPVLSFPEQDLSNTLTLASGIWTDNRTYVATYDVTDADEQIDDVDVQISGAIDIGGNVQTVATEADAFSIYMAPALLTPLPVSNTVEVTRLGTDNSVQLQLEMSTIGNLEELIIFSTEADGSNPQELTRFSLLEGGDLTDSLDVALTLDNAQILDGELLQFAVVDSGMTWTATPTRISDNKVRLSFEDVGQSLGDIVLSLQTAVETPTTNLLVGDADAIDLSSQSGDIDVSVTVYREAAFDNVLGFYTVDNAEGSITDLISGDTLMPGDVGYEAAALGRQLDTQLTAKNGEAITSTFEVMGGGFLGMFLIADGSDPATDEVYFSYSGMNNNGNDRVKQLGSNMFGFEDMVGLGDRDYNDFIVKFEVS
ncbi:Ig-like domain-containing protein, partial [cf. Phormidesmis sp. LEGE 11477]|uniref:Ig-like domain-containing protein n=1 Tax=cf. Phormidesmis sp. LEGE 11477 TaxID=1828680 RepID=UPI00187E382A